MSRSVLLQLARDSIQEVLEAQKSIDKESLLKEHPLLNEKMNVEVKIYLKNELKSSYKSKNDESLLTNIIISAKKSAFEDTNSSPITTAEYLSCEIELLLDTADGVLSQKDKPIVKE